MNPIERSLSARALLENTGWMRALAIRLVRDPEEAENVVQETSLALLRNPPRNLHATGAWLRRVVHNLALQSHRQRYVRWHHEARAARPESILAEPDAMLERAELQRQLLDLVLDLPEPHRSTVLLRFFEKRTPRDIAERHAIAVTTVRARITKALEILRRRLDERYDGQRPTWCPLFARFDPPTVTPYLAQQATTVSAGSILKSVTLGGAFIVHKGILGASCVAVLLIGLGLGTRLSSLQGKHRDRAATLAALSPEAEGRLRDQLEQAQSAAATLRSENKVLRRANSELSRQLATREQNTDVSPPGPKSPTPSPLEWKSPLNWSTLASQIAESMDLLRVFRVGGEFTEVETARWLALNGELLKISAEAKSLSDQPFFDPRIFTDLTQALFGESLALNEDQLAQLLELNEAVLATAPPDVDTLSSLDKYLVRQRLLTDLWDGVATILYDEQREDWPAVRKFSQEVFNYGSSFAAGSNTEPKSFANNWVHNLFREAPSEEILESLQPFAREYLARGRETLAKYARDNEDLNALSEEDHDRMMADFLRLQEEYHNRITSHLSEAQREQLRTRPPLILRFNYGTDIRIEGNRTYF